MYKIGDKVKINEDYIRENGIMFFGLGRMLGKTFKVMDIDRDRKNMTILSNGLVVFPPWIMEVKNEHTIK